MEVYWLSFRASWTDDRTQASPIVWDYERKTAIADFADRVKGKRGLAIIHGFNSTMEGISDAYLSMYGQLDLCGSLGNYDYLLMIDWPGGSDGPLSWLPAICRANKVGPSLAKWWAESGISALSFITHSLGARVVLKALSAGMRADCVFLMAPAVDAYTLCDGKEFSAGVLNARVLAALFSHHDPVLKGAYRLTPDFDMKPCDPALGEVGFSDASKVPVNCFSVDCSKYVKSHGGYRSVTEIAKLIGWFPGTQTSTKESIL